MTNWDWWVVFLYTIGIFFCGWIWGRFTAIRSYDRMISYMDLHEVVSLRNMLREQRIAREADDDNLPD